MTAMDFRHYDNALGRFVCLDALAPFMPNFSPYSFAFNNPVYFSDPSGLAPASIMEMLQAAWDATPDGTNSVWVNDGHGNFDYAGNGRGGTDSRLEGSFINTDAEHHFYSESLPTVTIILQFGRFGSGRSFIGQLQAHVYSKGRFYQDHRDKARAKQWDEFQGDLEWLGAIPILGEPIDLINGLTYGVRGKKTEANLSLAAMIPVAGWGATGIKFIGKIDNIASTAHKKLSGTTKATGEGIPNSVYEYLSPNGQLISKHFYNDAGKIEFEINFKAHNMGGVHGHNMSIPGSIGSGHLPENHIPFMLIPNKYLQ